MNMALAMISAVVLKLGRAIPGIEPMVTSDMEKAIHDKACPEGQAKVMADSMPVMMLDKL
ncbi:hypothetical protein [Labrys neptuniae]